MEFPKYIIENIQKINEMTLIINEMSNKSSDDEEIPVTENEIVALLQNRYKLK